MSDSKSGLGGRPRRDSYNKDTARLKAAASGEKVRLNANVPAELYGRYKSTVERRGLTVTAAVVQHMHQYLDEYE